MKNKNNKKKTKKFFIDNPQLILWLKVMKPFLPKKIKITKPKQKWKVVVL